MTVLFIDDSTSVREILRFALEAEGYRVFEAADGREGVTLFREHQPAVTIVDIVMPEKDGIETVPRFSPSTAMQSCSRCPARTRGTRR